MRPDILQKRVNELLHYTDKNAGCHRRKIGCYLLDDQGIIVGRGYNGCPLQLGDCLQDETICPGRNTPAGQGANNRVACYSVHAELRALKQCIYPHRIKHCLSTKAPCRDCVLSLMTVPCEEIIFLEPSQETVNQELWLKAGLKWTSYEISKIS